ncbi:MAG: 50S ribosomal protein L25 [Proteobacteria bacterium]|nr:50S ribosomal protein L25 [Pseudomonadota bacterium]
MDTVEEFTLEFQTRAETGSAANRRFRRQGLIPTVIYSHGENSIAALLHAKQFIHSAERATSAQVFTLKNKDGKTFNDRPAIVKEVQIDHLKGRVLHVDFQVLKENEEITIRVPLQFVGEALGVKDQGGILSIATHEVAVRCLPRAIPRSLQVEVSGLKIGSSIHSGELPLPEGVRLAGNAGETIVSVVVPKAVVEEAPAAAAAEGAAAPAAEGAAAPAAEGAAGAEGAADKGAAKGKK